MLTISQRGAEELARRLSNIAGQVAHPTPVLKLINVIGVDEIRGNFRRQKNADGSPWPRLKYRTGTPLVDKIGRMPKGIAGEVRSNSVTIGAGYATRAFNAIHNFGGQAGRGHKTHIPQREYMFFTREGRERIVREVRSFVSRTFGGGRG